MKLKRFFTLILAFALCIAIFAPSAAMAQSSQTLMENYDSYAVFSQFIEANPSRVAGTVGENYAANWIYTVLNGFGYDVRMQTFTYFDGSSTQMSQNVAARMDNGKEYDIIIGAHYDCAAIGEGADDNASGVTALLLTAYALKDVKNLPYNIVIVAFGAEEPGLFGSTYYVKQMGEKSKASTAMMINFDSIGMGDYLYIYGEDVKTEYASTFLAAAQNYYSFKGYEQKVYAKPLGKGIMMNIQVQFSTVYPYYQTAQASDHSPFRAEGIATTFFFAGNYSTSTLGYVQSQNQAFNVMHTKDDTAEYIAQNRGIDFAQKIEIVSSTVVNVLTNSAFENIIINARQELVPDFWLSVWPAAIIVFFLVVGVIIFSVLYLKKLNKRSLIEDVEVKTEKVFKAQSGEDIYDFLK